MTDLQIAQKVIQTNSRIIEHSIECLSRDPLSAQASALVLQQTEVMMSCHEAMVVKLSLEDQQTIAPALTRCANRGRFLKELLVIWK